MTPGASTQPNLAIKSHPKYHFLFQRKFSLLCVLPILWTAPSFNTCTMFELFLFFFYIFSWASTLSDYNQITLNQTSLVPVLGTPVTLNVYGKNEIIPMPGS